MKYYTLFLVSLITLSSCNNKTKSVLISDGRYSQQESLISMSKCFYTSNDRIFSFNYSCLDSISDSEYKRVKDSLFLETYIPYSYDDIRRFLYVSQLEHNVLTEYALSKYEIRKYFGRETLNGVTRNQDSLLFYYFDNKFQNCLESKTIYNPYGNCALMTFKFSSSDSLISMNAESVKYE